MMEEANKVVNILRAKDKERSEKYLLKEHILEALKRLEEYREYVESNEVAIKSRFNDEFFKSLTKALFIHDLGKIDYNFQRKVFNYEEIRRADGEWKILKDFFESQKEMKNIRHEILSSLWSTFMLGKENTMWSKKIRTAVLLHHYNDYYLDEKDIMEIIMNDKVIERYLEFISEKKKEFSEVIKALIADVSSSEEIISDFIKQTLNEIQENIDFDFLSELLKRIKAHDDDISKLAEFYEIDNENMDYDFLILLGVIRRCDYSASSGVSVEIEDDINKVFEDVDKKIKEKIKLQEAEELWQNRVLNSYKNNKNLILIAPTGSGKTEFALLWAKEMKRKLIYTLPLRVALNDLFMRFEGEKNGYFYRNDRNYVGILHSTSFIEYINEERIGKGVNIEHQIHSSEMFSFPIILTTPDQVFLTSLNFYGSDKLISLYPTSSVVIDEIQTYNEETVAIILKTLQIINKLSGNTLIITATFPPYLKKFFESEDFFNEKYTIIDLTKEDEIKKDVKNYNLKRHKISLVKDSIFEVDKKLTNKSREIIRDNNKDKNILIVVNDVAKAINIFKELENPKIDQQNIYLLHSRLIEKEKTRRIKEIEDKLREGKKGMVVVATQIVEASVDIDFDILITEISTIDSQIQRWGRIYRNRKEDYNGEKPNIYIFVGKENEGKPVIDKVTTYIYDEKVIKETINVLKEYEKKGLLEHTLDYEEERSMIEEVFNRKIGDKSLREIYEDKIEEILSYLKYFTVEKKSEAQRLFRNIAGTHVVIPQLMEENELKRFAKIIEDHKVNLSWEKIIKEIEGVREDTINKTEKKLTLKKALYEYSVNIPQYYIERYSHIISHEFKGFNVLKIDILKNHTEDIKKYGIDEYLKNIKLKNIEELMREENII